MSAHKGYGQTWWGAQWLNSLSQIEYDNRLPRGCSYANKGSVTKIEIRQGNIHACRGNGSDEIRNYVC